MMKYHINITLCSDEPYEIKYKLNDNYSQVTEWAEPSDYAEYDRVAEKLSLDEAKYVVQAYIQHTKSVWDNAYSSDKVDTQTIEILDEDNNVVYTAKISFQEYLEEKLSRI